MSDGDVVFVLKVLLLGRDNKEIYSEMDIYDTQKEADEALRVMQTQTEVLLTFEGLELKHGGHKVDFGVFKMRRLKASTQMNACPQPPLSDLDEATNEKFHALTQKRLGLKSRDYEVLCTQLRLRRLPYK